MYTKESTLVFIYCNAKFSVMFDGDENYIFTLTELIEDEENLVMKDGSITEVSLGVDEVKELIRTLQSLLPNKEEKE